MEEFKYVEIGGSQVKLLKKMCQGGCGQTFWGFEHASNICVGCSKKTPEQRAKRAIKREENKRSVRIFGYDGVSASIPREQRILESKSEIESKKECDASEVEKEVKKPEVEKEVKKPEVEKEVLEVVEKPIVGVAKYSLTLDGVVVDNLRKSDYDLIDLFVKNNRPLSMNDLFELFYGISVAGQKDYAIEELQIKRATLISKISRVRKILEVQLGGVWFGQKKGYWKLKGRPEDIDKVTTIAALDEKRKKTPRARPNLDLVDKAVESLTKTLDDVSNKLKDKEVNVESKDKEVVVEKSNSVDGDDEIRWQKCITRAKSIKEMVRNNRLLLADIALEACDIIWGGGGHWNNYSRQRTVSDFGAAIGINAKTLYEWINVKQHVVNKLKRGDYSAPKLWKILRAVQEKVNKDTDPATVQEIYNRELSRDGPNLQIKRVIRSTKSTKHFVTKTDLSEIHKEDLEELKTTCWEIVTEMEHRMGSI